VEITKFFKTHVAPIDPSESLEVVVFMDAADLSQTRGGAALPLSEIMK